MKALWLSLLLAVGVQAAEVVEDGSTVEVVRPIQFRLSTGYNKCTNATPLPQPWWEGYISIGATQRCWTAYDPSGYPLTICATEGGSNVWYVASNEYAIVWCDKQTGEDWIAADRRGYINPLCIQPAYVVTNHWRRVTVNGEIVVHTPRIGTNAPRVTVTKSLESKPWLPITGTAAGTVRTFTIGAYTVTLDMGTFNITNNYVGVWPTQW